MNAAHVTRPLHRRTSCAAPLATLLLPLLLACGGVSGGAAAGSQSPPVTPPVTPPVSTPGAPTVVEVLADLTGLSSGQGSGGQAVTILGTNFAPGATVHFGAAAATGVVWQSATTLTAVTPVAQPAGPVDVTVTLPGTGLAGTLHLGFTFLGAPPHLVAMNVVGSPSAGGGLMLLQGTGLQAGTVATFGGVTAAPGSFTPGTLGANDQLVVTIPPSPILPAGADGFVDVVVHDPDGQVDQLPSMVSAGVTWPGNFHYGPPPAVSGFAPTGGKGVEVTITGTGFWAEAGGPRHGVQVLMSGPGAAGIKVHNCPQPVGTPAGSIDPFCTPGLVTPTATSIDLLVPGNQINPGNYTFVVSNADGQFVIAPGVFVVP